MLALLQEWREQRKAALMREVERLQHKLKQADAAVAAGVAGGPEERLVDWLKENGAQVRATAPTQVVADLLVMKHVTDIKTSAPQPQ